MTIDLCIWATAGQRAILEFQKSVEALLPHNISASHFQTDELTDDLFLAESPHRQNHNIGWINSWIADVEKELLKPGEQSHKLALDIGLSPLAVEKWLEFDQNYVLPSLANVLALTCGAGLNEFKYGYLCFDSSEESSRNLWLLSNGLFAFNDPVDTISSTNNGRIRLFAFCRDVTKHLTIYLFILRPLAVSILSRIGRNVPLFSTHIWARIKCATSGHQQWQWSGVQICQQVKAFTFKNMAVVLTPQLFLRIVTKLFEDSLPELFATEKLSVVDRQAQHTSFTSVNNYGWVSNFPPVKYLRLHQPMRHLAVCEIWHSLLQLGQINSSWAPIITKAALTFSLAARVNAVKVANDLIKNNYAVKTAEDAKKILETRPFVQGLLQVNISLRSLFGSILRGPLGTSSI